MVIQSVPELMVPFIDEAGHRRWRELRQFYIPSIERKPAKLGDTEKDLPFFSVHLRSQLAINELKVEYSRDVGARKAEQVVVIFHGHCVWGVLEVNLELILIHVIEIDGIWEKGLDAHNVID